jgi:hypothetical protein
MQAPRLDHENGNLLTGRPVTVVERKRRIFGDAGW